MDAAVIVCIVEPRQQSRYKPSTDVYYSSNGTYEVLWRLPSHSKGPISSVSFKLCLRVIGIQ
jgi:hypothetical protein